MVRLHPLSHCMSAHGMCVPPAAPLNSLHGLISWLCIKNWLFLCVWQWPVLSVSFHCTVFGLFLLPLLVKSDSDFFLCSPEMWFYFSSLHSWCNFCLTCDFVASSQYCVLYFVLFFSLLWNLNVPFFPPRHERLCSTWSIPTLVPLLLLQKNWLCASQDDSLLPPTALAELTMGDHYTTDGTELHPLTLNSSVPLHSFAASLLSLSLTFLHCSWQTNESHTETLTWIYAPCGQTGRDIMTTLWSASPWTPKR